MGEDRKLARWDALVAYFRHFELVELGKSTLGKPFVMAVFGGDARSREIAKILAQGRVSEGEARRLAKEGKAIVLITCNLHSTEIGSSQTAPELAYELSRMDLRDVVVLLMPSINPDGQVMVSEWYDKHRGTEFEGGPMPWLYHPYAGHDNNRDFVFNNLAETRLVSEVYYKSWFPHVIVDHHQMGATGPRMFAPPYAEPVSPNLHPLVTRWLNVFGTGIALDMEAAGLRGVTHQHRFPVANVLLSGRDSLIDHVRTVLEAIDAKPGLAIVVDIGGSTAPHSIRKKLKAGI